MDSSSWCGCSCRQHVHQALLLRGSEATAPLCGRQLPVHGRYGDTLRSILSFSSRCAFRSSYPRRICLQFNALPPRGLLCTLQRIEVKDLCQFQACFAHICCCCVAACAVYRGRTDVSLTMQRRMAETCRPEIKYGEIFPENCWTCNWLIKQVDVKVIWAMSLRCTAEEITQSNISNLLPSTQPTR